VVEFDADGNMLGGGLNQFDSRNRLIQAENVVYAYDAENQRIGVNQTQYVVNSQPALSQILIKDENGQKTFYVYGLGLIGQETGDEYLSYHFDYRGSTVALTDSSGQIVEQYQYSPYGLLLNGDPSKTPFLFNGKYGVMTDSNNLYYMRARFYSPEIKRFINQDILLGGIGEGQTLNRYAFVTGQPVSFVDPFGLKVGYVDPVFLPLIEKIKSTKKGKELWEKIEKNPLTINIYVGKTHCDTNANPNSDKDGNPTKWKIQVYTGSHDHLKLPGRKDGRYTPFTPSVTRSLAHELGHTTGTEDDGGERFLDLLSFLWGGKNLVQMNNVHEWENPIMFPLDEIERTGYSPETSQNKCDCGKQF